MHQSAAPHLHVEPEVGVAAYDVRNEPLKSEQQVTRQAVVEYPLKKQYTRSRSLARGCGRWGRPAEAPAAWKHPGHIAFTIR